WDDVAVFYRTNAQSRVLEDALRRGGIPYVIVGAVRFYERKEIKDALAYLRLVVNPTDDVAFRRAIQAPGRGVGRASLVHLEELAAREGRSLLTLAAAPPVDVTGKPRRALEEFAALVTRLAAEREKAPLPAFIDLVLDASGYREDLKSERSSEAEARLENLEELIAAAEDYARVQEPATLEGFLDGVALVSDVDELPDGARGVTLLGAAGRADARPAPEAEPGFANADDDLPLKVGARVRHGRWGEGLVVGVERSGGDTLVTVRFASVGRKQLSLQYANLEEL